jgi:surface polysaccharide O-acyltransferase-like enzyme
LQRFSKKAGNIALLVALIATLILFPLAMIGDGGLKYFVGFHWPVFLYALWESIMGVCMSLGLLMLLRRIWSKQGTLGKFLANNTYGVYVIHAIVLVLVSLAFSPLPLHPLLKFVFTTLIAVPLCFASSALIRKIPFVRSIL